MTENNLQKELFNYIKESLPPHVSMVSELATLLNLSYDSVYRRIRGEKPLPLDELKTLCGHFNLSLDQVLQLESDKVLFTDIEANAPISNFKEYLQGLYKQLKHFNSFEKKEMWYLSKDVPVFYFFYFKELAAFKSFFWSKSILNDSSLERKNFSLADYDVTEYFELGQQVLNEYNSIPSVELWNYESINSTILQIEYYRDAGIFETIADLNKVVDSCDAMLLHIQHQLEKGRKFMPGIGETGYRAVLKFYINEIILGNNSILVQMDEQRSVFINHIVLKYISTNDKRFTEKAFSNFQNLVSRSVMISETGEKERNRFFKAMRERLQACRR
ncbi:MAG: helix-turn-helix domain-containing protein [Ferruginibacter sp.]